MTLTEIEIAKTLLGSSRAGRLALADWLIIRSRQNEADPKGGGTS